jgi:hypothetical protein
VQSFSNASNACNHVTLGLPIDKPKPLRQFDPTFTVQPTKYPYLQFSKPNAQKDLANSYVNPDEASIFPRNIYSREPLAGGNEQYPHFSQMKNRPRDINTHYTYSPSGNKERSEHPEYFSRFSYDRFPNEYGFGLASYGYIEPEDCHLCHDNPPGMAPEEFYDERYSTANLTEFKLALQEYNQRR